MTKVSVIVPVYKVESFLRKCLDSVVNQTLKDIEIIIIDEGDFDECRKIIDEYAAKDSRIIAIHEKNGCYGTAVNKGLEIAQGKYVSIIESDDYAELNMLADLYNLAEKHNCDVVKSDWFNYWGEGERNIKCSRIPNSDGVTNALEDKTLLKIQPSIWSAIYNLEFLNTNKIRFLNTNGGTFQDTSFHLKVMMCAKKVLLTNKAYIHYRQDNPNSSVKSKGKVYALCDEFNEIENFVKAREDLSVNFLEQIYSIQYRAYFGNLLRISDEYVNDFIEVYSAKFKTLYEQGVLRDYFFKRNRREEVMALIFDKEKFFKIYKKKLKRKTLREMRKNLISIHIDTSHISIVLFGREIVRIG